MNESIEISRDLGVRLLKLLDALYVSDAVSARELAALLGVNDGEL